METVKNTQTSVVAKDFKSSLLKVIIMKAGRGDSTLKIQKITSLDETFLKTETIHSLISEMQIIKQKPEYTLTIS